MKQAQCCGASGAAPKPRSHAKHDKAWKDGMKLGAELATAIATDTKRVYTHAEREEHAGGAISDDDPERETVTEEFLRLGANPNFKCVPHRFQHQQHDKLKRGELGLWGKPGPI